MFLHYYWVIVHGTFSTVRMAINDVPFYDQTVDKQESTSSPAIHLLKPGHNTLAVDVIAHEPTEDTMPMYGEFRITEDYDHDASLVQVKWPQVFDELPEEQRDYPLHYETTFEPGGEVFEPAYLNAPANELSEAELEEVRKAVFDVHRAVNARDADAYIKLMSLKLDEYGRAYGPVGFAGIQEAQDEVRAHMAEDTSVKPFEPEKLILEPRADGRVVHVRHAEGYAIDSQSTVIRGNCLETDLTFTKHEGRWQVFR